VRSLLKELGVDVTALVGAPLPPGKQSTLPVPPASRLEVLRLLIEGGFDLLHYTGHGTFDADDPSGRAGWLFADGLLTARELESMERPPQLVVANACFSGRLAATRSGQGGSEVGLLPSLADEFLRRGVRNYVGTAWEVSDAGSVAFSRSFYRTLLSQPPAGEPAASLGDAMFEARRSLHGAGAADDPLWAAYQHYGDPTLRLVAAEARPDPTG
jgi:CHAT domain-containing protein